MERVPYNEQDKDRRLFSRETLRRWGELLRTERNPEIVDEGKSAAEAAQVRDVIDGIQGELSFGDWTERYGQ